ncbi:26S protease regulatory subunit (plasmid) [Halarchaeum sp. CBA1220]|uniref:AAA family ATPase n=1 Tax=Halarchaeum sp. CBA1220 TaxID=1853682 RepID=UPI0011CD9959|nr:AAA family ATPase [Halarchaeum sp. CBA1220]QLC35580.1 26S protease regulatory subunit [Halarchaeum sp. CBA1220]
MIDDFDDVDERADESDEDRIEDVTVTDESFGTLEAVASYDETKARLRRRVVETADYERYGTTSVLLFGASEEAPTGELADALTGAFGAEYTFVFVDTVTSGFMDAESTVEAALRKAREREPSVVVLDCLDEYAFDEDEYAHLERHLDTVRASDDRVLVVATASDDDVDLSSNDTLFEVVVEVPDPDETYRRSVVETALRDACDAGVVTLDNADRLADLDVRDLSVAESETAVRRAIQRSRASSDTDPVSIHPRDIQSAVDIVGAERFDDTDDGFFDFGRDEESFEPDVPDVSFRDVGGLDAEKRRLREAATIPVEHSDTFREAGYSVGQGILLHGPPGNGKTMLAKAVANELDYHFLSVKGPEIEQPLVGESERELRELFGAAREHAPSVVFFDEFDSLAPDRASGRNEFKNDLVNTLLSELDGLEALKDVIVLAATNRLDHIDPAVLRSGRFDTFIEVPPPDADGRREIFDVHAANLPLEGSVSADWFADLELDGFSGADVATVCRKALERAVASFEREERDSVAVTRDDVLVAVDRLRSESTTDERRGFQ